MSQLLDDRAPPGHSAISNRHVTMNAFEYLSEAFVRRFWDVELKYPLKVGFLTAFSVDGFISVINPYLRLEKLKQHLRNVVGRSGLNGVFIVEGTPFRDAIFEVPGRHASIHFHGPVWSYDEQCDFREIEQSARSVFTDWLGIPGFRLTTRRDFCSKELRRGRSVDDWAPQTTPDDLCFLIAYSLKHVAEMKQVKVDRDNPFKYVLENDKGVSQKLALQMARIRSYISPYDAVFSVGQGKHIRAPYAKSMREWETSLAFRNSLEPGFDLDVFWRAVDRLNPRAGLGKSHIFANYKDG